MSTSGIDLNDPGISKAYIELVNEGVLRWILLGYTTKLNQLRIFASGKGDVDEMKEHVRVEDICYGVFSEPSRNRGIRLTVTYIPDTIGGVWRARALVHGKAVAAKFMTHEMIRISDIDQFHVQKIRSALRLPPRVTDYQPSQSEINRSAPSLDVVFPPPRDGSLKPSIASRKIVSNRLYSPCDAQNDPLNSAESETSLPSPPNNSTQLSLFSMMTGTAAIENFRLRSDSPSPSPAVKLSNGSASLPSPPKNSDDDVSDLYNIPSDAESSKSSRRVDASQSPQQGFSPGPFQASDSSDDEDSEGEENHRNFRASLDYSDHLEEMQDSRSIASSTFARPKVSSTTKLSSVSRDKPLPPIRLSSLNLIEGLSNLSDSSLPYTQKTRSNEAIEGLPVNPQQPQGSLTRKSGDSVRSTTRSALPSPPSSPEGLKLQLSITPVPALPQVTIQPKSPESPIQTKLPSVAQALDQIQSPSTTQSGRGLGALSEFQSTRQIQPRSRESPTTVHLPLYGTYRNNPNAVQYLGSHRRLSTAIDEAEERKLAVLEEERRRRTMWLAEREKEEKREQEMRDREFMERKEQERLKRLVNARHAEMVRTELKRREEEAEARKQAEQKKRVEEKLTRQSRVRERIKSLGGMLLLSGFVNVLSGTTWKRRYYQLTTEEWKFFKNDEDMSSPLSVLALSRIKAIREWDEGYEELEFMPNGFAVELTDGAPWLFFVDSKEEKDIFSGLLGQAGGQ